MLIEVLDVGVFDWQVVVFVSVKPEETLICIYIHVRETSSERGRWLRPRDTAFVVYRTLKLLR